MAYIDLSSPTNTAASTTSGNDLSALPLNVMQSSAPSAPTAPPEPSQSSTGPVALPSTEETKKSEPTEDHMLLRNVPPDLTTNPTSVSDGVKEFKGPELQTEPTVPAAAQQNLNIAPAPAPTVATLEKTPTITPPVSESTSGPVQAQAPAELVMPIVDLKSSGHKIEPYLDQVVAKHASDLHIAVGFPPTMRMDGQLIPLGTKDLTAEETKLMLEELLSKRLKGELLTNYDVDFSYTHRSGERFRVNIFWSKGTMAGAFRYISSTIRSISDLNLPSICFDLIKKPHGLVLLTGPTGSGKSTSIAAMIQEVNLTVAKHIVTIEDPIEYVFPRAKSIVNQREIGGDVANWKRALRELLRQDPNVVVVGEMRDYETIAATITVAETGHLVFATLHTNSASQTVDRIIDVFPEVQQPQIRAQLANVIAAVISQRLVPLQNGGRKAVFEVMVAIPAVKNAIREGKTYQIDNIIQTNVDQGMVTLEKSLVQLIRNGEITVETAKEFTTKPDELDSLLRSN